MHIKKTFTFVSFLLFLLNIYSGGAHALLVESTPSYTTRREQQNGGNGVLGETVPAGTDLASRPRVNSDNTPVNRSQRYRAFTDSMLPGDNTPRDATVTAPVTRGVPDGEFGVLGEGSIVDSERLNEGKVDVRGGINNRHTGEKESQIDDRKNSQTSDRYGIQADILNLSRIPSAETIVDDANSSSLVDAEPEKRVKGSVEDGQKNYTESDQNRTVADASNLSYPSSSSSAAASTNFSNISDAGPKSRGGSINGSADGPYKIEDSYVLEKIEPVGQAWYMGREVIKIGFLPALTANKGESKFYYGAFFYALSRMNKEVLQNSRYYLDYVLYDMKADSAESIRGMTYLYNNGCKAFVGPEGSCVIEASLAAAWNIPMFAFKCRESTVSNRNGQYPTFVRTIPSTSKVSKSLISLMKYFKWDTFQTIVANTPLWMEAASTLGMLAQINGLKINEDVNFKEKKNIEDYSELMHQILINTKDKTRVYVFLGNGVSLLAFVRELKKMNKGEYVVIAVDESPYNYSKRHNHMKDYLETLEEWMIDAFDNVLVLLPSTPSNPDYNTFLDISRYYSQNAPYKTPTAPYYIKPLLPIFAAYLYDAVGLYARALKEASDDGTDYENGTAIINKIKKRTYESIQGNTMFIDFHGNAEANYTLLALLPDRGALGGRSLKEVGHFITHEVQIPDFTLVADIPWPHGSVPESEPMCGFDGSKCETTQNQAFWLVVIIGMIVLSILVITIVFSCRHYIYEQKLASLLWKIDYKEFVIPEHDSDPDFAKRVIVGPFGILSTNVNDQEQFVNKFKVVQYKNQTVAVKVLKKRHIELTRVIRKELYQMKELNHDNINRFIGACVEQPYVYIAMHYCSRGSLKDIIENEDIHLDHIFIASFIFDLIKGMIYLHDSPLVSHGHLRPSNCLVDSRWVLQISDYGLCCFREEVSHDIFKDDQLISKLLWYAPELLRSLCVSGRGSQKGDVYSFALILYEIHARVCPWSTLCIPKREILQRLKYPLYNQMLRPDVMLLKCQEFVTKCLQDCWHEEDVARPDFRTIRNRLKPLQQGLSSNIIDNMLAKMETHAANLESLVNERTFQLAEEKKKTEALLLSILPSVVAEQLMREGEVIPESYECVTIYFSDIVAFTTLSAESTPMQIIDMLNDLYTLFDTIIGSYDVYKVETIGDAYMVVSGLPIRNEDMHAGEIASMSLHLLRTIASFRIRHQPQKKLQLRIGIHSGPVVAGVVGRKMPRYCLFGDTVNTASRVESTGVAMKVHCSEASKIILDKLGGYILEKRGITSLKGRGQMMTYFVSDEDTKERLRRISADKNGELQHKDSQSDSENQGVTFSNSENESSSNENKNIVSKSNIDFNGMTDAMYECLNKTRTITDKNHLEASTINDGTKWNNHTSLNNVFSNTRESFFEQNLNSNHVRDIVFDSARMSNYIIANSFAPYSNQSRKLSHTSNDFSKLRRNQSANFKKFSLFPLKKNNNFKSNSATICEEPDHELNAPLHRDNLATVPAKLNNLDINNNINKSSIVPLLKNYYKDFNK